MPIKRHCLPLFQPCHTLAPSVPVLVSPGIMTTPAPPDLLTAVLGDLSNATHLNRPHVTLTFAQSLDAKIAGAGGAQLILSGRESMIMTHWCAPFPLLRKRTNALKACARSG